MPRLAENAQPKEKRTPLIITVNRMAKLFDEPAKALKLLFEAIDKVRKDEKGEFGRAGMEVDLHLWNVLLEQQLLKEKRAKFHEKSPVSILEYRLEVLFEYLKYLSHEEIKSRLIAKEEEETGAAITAKITGTRKSAETLMSPTEFGNAPDADINIHQALETAVPIEKIAAVYYQEKETDQTTGRDLKAE